MNVTQTPRTSRTLPRDTYQNWLSKDLVHVQATRVDSGEKFEHVDKAALLFKDLPRFFPLAGSTLNDAMGVAQAISRSAAQMRVRGDDPDFSLGYSPAVAVLQARDGAYWGAMLGTGTGRRGIPIYDPSWPHTRILGATALHTDVRALVGARDTMRFDQH